ncbi:MAG: transposase [Solirubrobacteraceae bacterium]
MAGPVGLLGLGERRAREWQARAAAGCLEDRRPGAAVHGLRPQEVEAILALACEWGEIDASHRKLAHRGSYLGRVWVSPSSVLRVLLEHGQRLPYRPARERSVKRPWPDWVDYKPLQVWGYDFSAFTAAQTSALAILDLVSRKWIDTMLCQEATDVQVQALFLRALEAEGLLQLILDLADGDDDERCPVLLIVSDNGAQMTSGSTREFMALHALATHYGRPGTPTDQAHIESLWGHVKHDWPHLETLADPADLSRELEAARREYNTVRLHAAIGYVTPDDEHEGRGPRIRAARRAGLEQARLDRIAYHASSGWRPARDRAPAQRAPGQLCCPAHQPISEAATDCQGQPDRAQQSWPRSGGLDRPRRRSYP